MNEWASERARAVRREVFRTFAQEGRPPTTGELSTWVGCEPNETQEALRELHELHALVLSVDGETIRMAHPFSSWPMGFALHGGDRMWWGGCAWDSFGIVAALKERLTIVTTCLGSGQELRYEAGPDQAPPPSRMVVRVPRPAAEWWDDVVATCSAIRVFASQDALDAWLERTGEPPGRAVSLEALWRLSLSWYGDRLDDDWSPQTTAERQAQLESNGFTGPFWALP